MSDGLKWWVCCYCADTVLMGWSGKGGGLSPALPLVVFSLGYWALSIDPVCGRDCGWSIKHDRDPPLQADAALLSTTSDYLDYFAKRLTLPLLRFSGNHQTPQTSGYLVVSPRKRILHLQASRERDSLRK